MILSGDTDTEEGTGSGGQDDNDDTNHFLLENQRRLHHPVLRPDPRPKGSGLMTGRVLCISSVLEVSQNYSRYNKPKCWTVVRDCTKINKIGFVP